MTIRRNGQWGGALLLAVMIAAAGIASASGHRARPGAELRRQGQGVSAADSPNTWQGRFGGLAPSFAMSGALAGVFALSFAAGLVLPRRRPARASAVLSAARASAVLSAKRASAVLPATRAPDAALLEAILARHSARGRAAGNWPAENWPTENWDEF